MSLNSHAPVWYVSYGSNMCADRFGCYLAGGRAAGALRTQPGCRDKADPLDDRPVRLAGQVYFALESKTWTGGLALYDPAAAGEAAARAYLVTTQQFSDIAAQEMHRDPDNDLDLTGVRPHGRMTVGPGRYETVAHCGELEGYPLLTVTAPWTMGEAELNAPAARYLQMLGDGLADAHGWDVPQVAAYLLGLPGVTPTWTRASLHEVLAADPAQT